MIKLNQITKHYNGVTAVDAVSLEVPATGSLVILGPSGSGKTTLLRLMAGLEIPDAGEIYIDGQLASRQGWALPPHRRGLGFVFQSPALWPHMSVAQNILFGLHPLPKKQARARLSELLVQTGLEKLAGRYPHQLSGGEARRVSLARSLAPRPRYLLMDEPLTNLDMILKNKLLALIKETVSQSSAGLVYVTHDSGEAKEIGGPVLVLENGRLSNSYSGL